MHPCIRDAPCHYGEYECSMTKGEKILFQLWNRILNLFFYNRHGLLRWAVCCIILQSTKVWHLVHNFVRALMGEGCWIFCFVFQYNKGLELLKAICRHRGDSKGKLIQSQLDPQRHDWGRGHFVLLKEKKITTGKYAGFTEVRLYDS